MIFFKITNLLLRCKIIFKNPSKTDLLVLDDSALNSITFLINRYDHLVLPIRYYSINKVYISFDILLNFIKNIRKTKITTAYFCALITIIQPKLILTVIDNSLQVSDIAKVLSKKFNFLAIQNAARYEFDEFGKEHSKKFFIPELACFGHFEKKLYKKHGVKVNKFSVCGSIKLANYKNFMKLNKKKIKFKKKEFDICLISEPSSYWDKILPGFEKSIGKIADFTVRVAKKHNLKLVFVGKRPKFIYENSIKKINKLYIDEVDFYKTHIKDNFKILNRNIESYSSYQAMHNSKLTIAMMSSMLRENFVLGGKSLACNFTNNKAWDFPIKGICSIKDFDFDKFEKRVLEILSISHKKYFASFKQKPKYLIHLNKNQSTQDLLKKKIRDFLI